MQTKSPNVKYGDSAHSTGFSTRHRPTVQTITYEYMTVCHADYLVYLESCRFVRLSSHPWRKDEIFLVQHRHHHHHHHYH